MTDNKATFPLFWLALLLCCLPFVTKAQEPALDIKPTDSVAVESNPVDSLAATQLQALFLSADKVIIQGDTSAIADLDSTTRYIVNFKKQQEVQKRYNEAVGLLNSKKWNEAQSQLDKVLELDTAFRLAYVSKGLTYLPVKEYQKAIDNINKAIALDEQAADERLYFGRATALYQLKKHKEALPDFLKAAALNPKNAQAWYYAGLVEFENEAWDRAIAHFTQAIESDYLMIDAYNDRGSAKRMKDDLEGAERDYSKAVLSKPGSKIYLNNRGSVRTLLKKYDKAIEDFSTIIALDSKDFMAYNNRGNAYFENEQYEEAEKDFSKSISINPKYAYAWNNRSAVRFKLKKYAEAETDAAKAISLNKDYGYAYLNRGIAREMLRKFKGACEDWEQAGKLGIKTGKTYRQRDCFEEEWTTN